MAGWVYSSGEKRRRRRRRRRRTNKQLILSTTYSKMKLQKHFRFFGVYVRVVDVYPLSAYSFYAETLFSVKMQTTALMYMYNYTVNVCPRVKCLCIFIASFISQTSLWYVT